MCKGGDIYIETTFNCEYCGSGDIHIEALYGGSIYMCADENVFIGVDGELCLAGDCIALESDYLSIDVEEMGIYASGDVCFIVDGDVDFEADSIIFGGTIRTDDALLSCGTATFASLVIEENDGEIPLVIYAACEHSCEPIISLIGVCCGAFGDCKPVWDGVSTGEDNAKYCLAGGIFVRVNGCQRYIKFHRPLT